MLPVAMAAFADESIAGPFSWRFPRSHALHHCTERIDVESLRKWMQSGRPYAVPIVAAPKSLGKLDILTDVALRPVELNPPDADLRLRIIAVTFDVDSIVGVFRIALYVAVNAAIALRDPRGAAGDPVADLDSGRTDRSAGVLWRC